MTSNDFERTVEPEDGKLIKAEESGNGRSEGGNSTPSSTSNDMVIDVEMDTAAAVKAFVAAKFTVEQAEVIVDLIRWITFVRLDEMARVSVSRLQMDHVKDYSIDFT